jgi:putative ATP-dependent endonuclease of OLD family
MSGPRQDIKPCLGFSPTDATRLYRNIRLLIDEGQRGINDASLGSANLVFLSLKALELRRMIEDNQRDHTFLAIEEPEAFAPAPATIGLSSPFRKRPGRRRR